MHVGGGKLVYLKIEEAAVCLLLITAVIERVELAFDGDKLSKNCLILRPERRILGKGVNKPAVPLGHEQRLAVVLTVDIDKPRAYLTQHRNGDGAAVDAAGIAPRRAQRTAEHESPVRLRLDIIALEHSLDRLACIGKARKYPCALSPRADKLPRGALAEDGVYRIYYD